MFHGLVGKFCGFENKFAAGMYIVIIVHVSHYAVWRKRLQNQDFVSLLYLFILCWSAPFHNNGLLYTTNIYNGLCFILVSEKFRLLVITYYFLHLEQLLDWRIYGTYLWDFNSNLFGHLLDWPIYGTFLRFSSNLSGRYQFNMLIKWFLSKHLLPLLLQ